MVRRHGTLRVVFTVDVSATTDSSPSIFERIGGAAAVEAVVSDLYERAGVDPDLGPFFHGTDLPVQRRKLAEMIGEALGGPPAPWLLGLREAHAGRAIGHHHFSLMASYLIDILIERGVGDDETDAITAWFAEGRDAVVDTD